MFGCALAVCQLPAGWCISALARRVHCTAVLRVAWCSGAFSRDGGVSPAPWSAHSYYAGLEDVELRFSTGRKKIARLAVLSL